MVSYMSLFVQLKTQWSATGRIRIYVYSNLKTELLSMWHSILTVLLQQYCVLRPRFLGGLSRITRLNGRKKVDLTHACAIIRVNYLKAIHNLLSYSLEVTV